jgi:hypothetical protein
MARASPDSLEVLDYDLTPIQVLPEAPPVGSSTPSADPVPALHVKPRRGSDGSYTVRTVSLTHIVQDFERIAQGRFPDFESFVAQYGPLPLCPAHYLPVRHTFWRANPSDPHNADIVECGGTLIDHPQPVYVTYAKALRAARRIAAALQHYDAFGRGRQSWGYLVKERQIAIEYFTLLPGGAKGEWGGRDDKPGAYRWAVRSLVNFWLKNGETRYQFDWRDGEVPFLRFSSNIRWAERNVALWGALAVRFSAILMTRHIGASPPCKGCGNEVLRTARSGRHPSYCVACRESGVPARIHSKAYRERTKTAINQT